MPVEDVSIPGARRVTDVKGGKEKDSADNEYWERKAKEVEARVKYESSQRDLDRVTGGGTNKEPAFQVKGSVDLGSINYQAMIQEQQQEKERLRQEAEENARAQAGANDDLRERLHQEQMQRQSEINERNIQILNLRFQQQFDKITEMIASGSTNRKSFQETLSEAREIVTALGYVKPSAETTNLRDQIELKRVDFDQALAIRKLDDENKQRDWQRQVDLRRLEDDKEAKKEAKEDAEKRWQLLPKGLETIGKIGAQALFDRAEDISKNPQQTESIGKHIVVGVGESGEFNCPRCNESVAVGSKTSVSVCAKCNARFPIDRKEKTENPAPKEVYAEEEL